MVLANDSIRRSATNKIQREKGSILRSNLQGRHNGNIYKSLQSFKLRLVSHVFQSGLRHLIVRGTCISKSMSDSCGVREDFGHDWSKP